MLGSVELGVRVCWYRGLYDQKYNTKPLLAYSGKRNVLYYSHYMLGSIVLLSSSDVLSVASTLA